MIYRPIICALMLCLSPMATASDLPPVTEQIVEESPELVALREIQTYLSEVQSLEANFSQHAPNGKISSGRMYLKRPGKVRFDYGEKSKILVVSDGKILSIVDNEVGQVTRWPVKDTPLSVLLGNTISFDGLKTRIVPAAGGQEHMIALMAEDPKKPEMGVITVYFRRLPDSAVGLIATHWVIVDGQGQTTRIALTNQKANIQLADNLWTYKDPRGSAKRNRLRK